MPLQSDPLRELVLQGLETEQGGIAIYEMAVECAQNDQLREEWEKYLEQTRRHEQILRELCEALGFDADEKSPGRDVVGHIGESLVEAMRKAQRAGDAEATQLVACECVVLAETKDHLNWELLKEVAREAKGAMKKAVEAAVEEVENEEDEHLYHTQGWTRELWLETLGAPSVIPPPEEEKHVKTAIGAARAKQQREELL